MQQPECTHFSSRPSQSWAAFFMRNQPGSEKDLKEMTELMLTVTEQALHLFETGDFFQLDALVGNSGCEVHTSNVLSLAKSQEMRQECAHLREAIRKIRGLKQNISREFFQTHVASVLITERMGYLIQSRLLTLIKNVAYDEQGYRIKDKTVYTPLKKFLSSKKSHDLVQMARKALSASSIQFLRAELNKLACEEEKRPILEMFEERNLSVWFEKTYSSCLYNTKALLLLSSGTPIFVRRLTRKGEDPCLMLFAQRVAGSPYVALTEKEIRLRNPLEPVIVCEAFFSPELGKVGIKSRLEHGLANILLATATQDLQYHIEKREVSDPIASREVEHYKAMAREYGLALEKGSEPFFVVEHFFCNTLQKEWERCEHEEDQS